MTYEDNPAGGSLFSLEVPLVTDEAGIPPSGPPASIGNVVEKLLAAPRPPRVLVVDDVAMNRDVAASFLRMGRL